MKKNTRTGSSEPVSPDISDRNKEEESKGRARGRVPHQELKTSVPSYHDFSLILTHVGAGRTDLTFRAKERVFTQGSHADCVYYLLSGSVKLAVVSESGKEATVSVFHSGDFLGEESVAGIPGFRLATATALTHCKAIRISRSSMLKLIHEQDEVSDLFTAFLLTRIMRTQADLIDHLFNSSERRLARILLLMVDFDKHEDSEILLPKISQDSLARMVGTTRSRVSYFMNRFRALGFIEYNGRIRVHKSLLNVLLHEHEPRTRL